MRTKYWYFSHMYKHTENFPKWIPAKHLVLSYIWKGSTSAFSKRKGHIRKGHKRKTYICLQILLQKEKNIHHFGLISLSLCIYIWGRKAKNFFKSLFTYRLSVKWDFSVIWQNLIIATGLLCTTSSHCLNMVFHSKHIWIPSTLWILKSFQTNHLHLAIIIEKQLFLNCTDRHIGPLVLNWLHKFQDYC